MSNPGWRRHPRNPNRNKGRKATEWWQFHKPALESDIEPVKQLPIRKRSPPTEWWKIDARPTTLTDWFTPTPPPPQPPSDSRALVSKETWKVHPEWKVQVSSYGRVWLPRGTKSFGSPNQRGYMRVTLRHPLKKTSHKVAVHRLVAEAHVSRREYQRMRANGFVVNHKNNDPSDNWFTNLEFVTGQGNAQHYWDTVYPDKKTEESAVWAVHGRASRPVWIVDEEGRVRQSNRTINIYNSQDREWLKELGLWDAIKDIIGE